MSLLKLFYLVISIVQTIHSSSYTCDQNDFTIKFRLSSSSHSSWDELSNCALSPCITTNDRSRSSQISCFDYRTIDNISYCAPASLCSILEPCDNITCTSNTSVCIVNSCCQTKTVYLPLKWTSLCSSTSQFFCH